MKHWTESHTFNRFLEIIPGFVAWSILLMPFIFAPIFPIFVAYFILAFNMYWFSKSINLMRHLLRGFFRMKRNMKIDFLERCKLASEKPEKLYTLLEKEFEKTRSKLDFYDWEEFANLAGHYDLIKDWQKIYHVIVVANCFEDISILKSTFDALYNSNYPSKNLIIVLAGEAREGDSFVLRAKQIEKMYQGKFNGLLHTVHTLGEGEVIGKGSNLYHAGHELLGWLRKERPEIADENILVTTLDADHIVHRDYFSRLTYKYIIDPNRDRKTYQPVPLLFNNIWDAPAPNRISAIGSSFWQIVEAMRPYRLRTFAAHAQSLKTLLVTDFWSKKTIVEDGHQYWRTYFAYNGDHYMVPLLIPVYQDCVMAETYWDTFKNQYLQRRRWAWGISDFPFIVKNFFRHPEISFSEKFLQTFRHFSGSISWSTASFLVAFAWVPLIFNSTFQDTVLAHNVTIYSSLMARAAWVGIFANIWVYFTLIPPKPGHHKNTRYIGMALQWLLSPLVAIFLSSLPAFESQTRLMIGKYLDTFFVTPKVRKTQIISEMSGETDLPA